MSGSDKILTEVGIDSPCWVWPRSLNADGYPVTTSKSLPSAHRAFYELTYGKIEPGLTLDHLCRNRACVNPEHLEPVTLAENIRRSYIARGFIVEIDGRDHCGKGHDRTAPGALDRSGACLACRRDWIAARRKGGMSNAQRLAATACKRGHPFDEANTYRTPKGGRGCRACRNAANLRHKEKKLVSL